MKKIVTAFLSGVAIGILIAPSKGAETRKKLADNLDRLRNMPARHKKKQVYQNALDTIGEHVGVWAAVTRMYLV